MAIDDYRRGGLNIKTASLCPDGPDWRIAKQEKVMKRFFIFVMFLTVLLGLTNVWAAAPAFTGQPDFGASVLNPSDYKPGSNLRNTYETGQSYSFTVHAPNSEDGAKAIIWGFYKPIDAAYTSATYGTGIFEDGYALVEYVVPLDYQQGGFFYWQVEATQKPGNGSITNRFNALGPWNQFDSWMLDGQTIEIETYCFEDFTMDRNTASFKMISPAGFPPNDVIEASVQVIKPWSGNLEDYNNSVYNNEDLYNKKGFYPGMAEDLGYTVVEYPNPYAPGFEKIHVYKEDIGFDLTLFGFRVNTPNDSWGHMWWTTFHIEPVAKMDMTYNPVTGEFTGNFVEPVPFDTFFCFQPYMRRLSAENGVYFDYYPGGSMDLIFTGQKLPPVYNETQGTFYTTIQDAIDEADPGDIIEVAAGEYNEAVVIDKAITLKSVDGAEDTIINCPDGTLTTGIMIQGTDLGTVTIDGFTIKGWTENGIVQGFSSSAGTSVHVSNNIIDSGGDFCRNGIQVVGDNSKVIGNTVLGATYYEDVQQYASSGILVIDGSNIEVSGNNVSGTYFGISFLCYTTSKSPMTDLLIENNTCSENAIGIDFESWWNGNEYHTFEFIVNNNILKNNLVSAIELYEMVLGEFSVTNNVFEKNPIHWSNWSETELTEEEIDTILTGNTFDHTFVKGQNIYGYGTMLYVDVPKEVIKDGETQTYSVVASRLDGLRGFKVVVNIPKADFATEPTSLTSGNDFDMMFFDPEHTDDEWIYSVSGTFMGGDDGISGDEVVLFTFDAKSTEEYSNVYIPGCWIELPLDDVVLRGDQNPQNFISCVDTYYGWVLIDNTAPTVEIVNLEDYPDYDENDDPLPYIIQHDGDGMVIPEFDLLYEDDYWLSSAMYLIVPDGGAAPSEPGDFADEVGPVADIETSINNWPLPINTLADGTYTIYFLVVDEAGNYSIISWDFVIDNTPPAAIVWDEEIPCRTTADANESIDLKWINADDVAENHIWVLSYGDAAVDNTHYPYYADHSEPTIIAPDPYGDSPQNGWVKFTIEPPASFPYVLAGLDRGYYYVTIFASDSAGNMSAVPEAPFYRESINYWPGDVTEDFGAVDGTDIHALSLAWGTVKDGDNWNELCDVGPSTDFARRSRPTPDGRIDFEDLMMFSMNYENTDYEWYPRNEVETDPVTITLAYQDLGGMLQVSLYLDGNDSFVTGLDIPVAYGSDLVLQNLEIGDIWPENSMLLQTNKNGVVTVSCAAFGPGAVIEGNGLVATLNFAVNGYDSGLELQRMTARGWDNSEIDIVGNPTGSVENEDVVNVIPDSSYLGSVHPNPFRSSATLQYGLKEAGSVRLGVYNTRGQLVRSLLNEGKSAGTYQVNWDGRDENGLRVSSGIYLFRLETTDVIKTQKAMLLK